MTTAVFGTRVGSRTSELRAGMTARTKPRQAQDTQDPSMEKGSGLEVLPQPRSYEHLMAAQKGEAVFFMDATLEKPPLLQ